MRDAIAQTKLAGWIKEEAKVSCEYSLEYLQYNGLGEYATMCLIFKSIKPLCEQLLLQPALLTQEYRNLSTLINSSHLNFELKRNNNLRIFN